MAGKRNPPKTEKKSEGGSSGIPVERRKLPDRRGVSRRYDVRRLDEKRAAGIGEIMDERRAVERRMGERRKGQRKRRGE